MTVEALIKKAQILVDALPYIQKFAGKTVVIKYGGNAMINEELKNQVMEDITILKFIGLNPIVVHGGGPDISKALDEKGVKSKFVNGLRVTDELTVQVAQEVLIGKTNKEIVSLLNKTGGRAVGISGIDASFIECEKQKTVADGEEVDIGYVGKIKHIKRCILDLLCNDQWIPVIAPIGVDEEGHSYNINADTVASEIAAAVQAEKLILLTDVEGIKDENGDIVYEAGIDRINEMIENGTINGGMIPKVKGCMDAIKRGVTGVHIIDGRIPHCLLLEIFTKTGIGSLIKSDKYLT
ncbi:MAG: acetylglutamate kinase [Clostridiales bacterium]|nr:acetylglutamate kinase [Clostridiales bacterium]